MPKFIDIHRGMQGLTPVTLEKAHALDEKFQGAEGVCFQRAWADPSSGTVFCLSEAPNKEAVQRVHERAGHPPDEVFEVSLEV